MKHSLSGAIAFFLIYFFNLSNIIYAQSAPSIEWEKCFGGMGYENGSCIIQTSDGGYVIAGTTDSDDGDVSGNHGSEDGWVVKFDSHGNILWQKCLGGSGNDWISSITRTFDGGYALAGYTNSTDGDVSGNHGNEMWDAWVVKLDSLGNIIWQKCLGGTGDDRAFSIIQVSNEGEGYVVVGYTTSTDGDVSGKHGGLKSDTADAWVVKLNSLGNIEWQKCLGGANRDVANSVIQSSDGGFVIAGNTASHDGDVSGFHGRIDGWVVKLNSAGSIVWQKCLGGSGYDEINKIIKTSDGGYVLAGQTNSKDGDVSGIHDTINDAWIIKLNSSGDILWQKCFGGTNFDAAYSAIQTSDNGFTLIGSTGSNDGDVSGYHGGAYQYWAVKLTSAGNLIWQKCLGGTGFDEAFSIVETSDRGYAICGRSGSNNGDVSGNHGGYDVWVVKLNAEAGVENWIAGLSNFSSVYPNPSLNQVHLQLYSSLSVKQVQFYNLLGSQYYPDYRIETTTCDVDEHNLPTGSYIMRVSYLNTHIEEVRKFLHYH